MAEIVGQPPEQAVLLGQRQALIGILTRPASTERAGDRAVVFLNTGVIHRVGHHRMFVTMARAVARAGYFAVRFDFSGVGDSGPRTDGLSPVESCLADIGEVLDWLEQEKGIRQIVLVGLCSGADQAILYGHSDPRVTALVLIDPTIPATSRYYRHYIRQRLIDPSNWIGVLTGRSFILRSLAEELRHMLRPSRDLRQVTLQNLRFHPVLEQSYRNSVARGIRMLAAFSQDSTRQTYREQILEAFPNLAFGDRLQLEFFRDSDHTFSAKPDRERLVELILTWLDPPGAIQQVGALDAGPAGA